MGAWVAQGVLVFNFIRDIHLAHWNADRDMLSCTSCIIFRRDTILIIVELDRAKTVKREEYM